jgi:hypothetical protein
VQVEAGTNIAAGEIASANVTNSLFKFTNNSSGDTICGDDGNYGVGSISIDHSLKMDAPQLNSGCTVTLGAGNRSSDSSAPADLFVNFDAGDLRLAPGSDAIDHGNSGTSHTDRGIDVFGGFRFVVGESGVDIIDMGAGEYQPYAPDRPTLQASATTVTVGQPINFTATATDGNEDALTYNWSFSEGTSSGNGATQSHTFTTVGEHFVEVWAHDGVYQSESSGKLLITVNPAPAPPSGGSTPVPTPKAAFGKQVGKFKPRKKGANGFKVSAKKVKDGYIPVVSSAKLQIKLSFEKPKGGYLVGGACKAKQGKTGSAKRCSLPLKGSQTLDLPAGTSYLAFAGKWNKKLLAPGKYTLVGVNPNMMPNRISMNVTVPKQGK